MKIRNKYLLFGSLIGILSYLLIQGLIFLGFYLFEPCYLCMIGTGLMNIPCLLLGIRFNCIIFSSIFYGFIGLSLGYLIFKFKNE